MTSPPPPPPPGVPASAPKKREWKWMAIGCGIAFLFILGILAAISIPNLLNAVQRAKQHRTMTQMRSVAEVVEAYAERHNRYPAARSIGDLAGALDPSAAATLPAKDGWEHDLRFQSSQTDYWIGSAGKDGRWERDALETYGVGTTTSFESDIVYKNGAFIQYPQGLQK